MNSQLIAALLLNFSATAGAMVARTPRHSLSGVSHQFGWLSYLVGTPAGLLAIYIFVQTHGWGYGLLYWFGSGVLSHLFLQFIFEGLRTILGTLAAICGFVLYFWM